MPSRACSSVDLMVAVSCGLTLQICLIIVCTTFVLLMLTHKNEDPDEEAHNELSHLDLHFKLAWTKSRKSYCTTPGVGVGVSVGGGGGFGVSKKVSVKVFYVMGKALSGELSCPCDMSCFFFLHSSN